jgi:hypothetical protein
MVVQPLDVEHSGILAVYGDDVRFTYLHDAAASYSLCTTHARTDLPLVFVTTLCPCVWDFSNIALHNAPACQLLLSRHCKIGMLLVPYGD